MNGQVALLPALCAQAESNMKLPANHTEAQVIEAVNNALSHLCDKYAFGIYTEADLYQEGWCEALKLLELGKYDHTRPLAAYVFTHVSRRFMNLSRDRLFRLEPPCTVCHKGDFCTNTNQPCSKYRAWYKRNMAKASLQRPLGMDHVSDTNERNTRSESTVCDDLATKELLRKIDTELPIELRTSYLQMRAGVNIPKAKRRTIESAIRSIIGSTDCDDE